MQTSIIFKPQHDKTNKMTSAPSEDLDKPGHPPSLIRDFAVRMKKGWVLSIAHNSATPVHRQKANLSTRSG